MYFLCLTTATPTEKNIEIEKHLADMAQGNSEAIAELYQKTSSTIYGLALSILKNAFDAEDVLQDTYLRVYAAAGRYVPNGRPMPWILTIARNLTLMKLRDCHGRRPANSAGRYGRAVIGGTGDCHAARGGRLSALGNFGLFIPVASHRALEVSSGTEKTATQT